MKTRAKQGSTLSLVVACTIVLVLLGIGFIALTFIFGGHREAQHAVDSGSLNVSKRAILSPAVQSSALDSDVGRAMAANLSAPQGSNINMGTGVNLLSFNRMVAQAMLVALNAEAEGQGQANAQQAFNFVEGSAGSIGAQLKTLLSDNSSGSWAENDYNEVSGNVLKMLGGQGAPNYNSADFQVAYMNQRNGDFNGTNVDMSAFDPTSTAFKTDILPIKDYSNPTQRNNFNSKSFVKGSGSNANVSFLAGFTTVTTAGCNFMGVPTNPGMQPHLESTNLFSQETNQPGSGTVYLPPNAFKIGGMAAATPAHDNGVTKAHVVSVSMIGTPQTPFPLQIPGGYIIVDNAATQSFSGHTPNTDNVAAHELGTGILVDKATGYFSYGSDPNGKGNLIDQWQAYDHDPSNFQPSGSDPPYSGIYDSSGNALSSATQAAKIPYVPNPSQTSPPSILCTDNNSSAPGGDATCIQEASGTSSVLSPFDKAYHPNSLNNNGGTMSTTDSTASELAQCQVIDLYGPTPHGGGPSMDYNYNFGPTGMRRYPDGLPSAANQYAWQGPAGGGFGMAPDSVPATVHTNASSTCKVTEDGTIQEYFQQVEAGNNIQVDRGASNTSVLSFLKQRMLEIQPSATTAQLDQVLQTPIALGKTYYIYQKNGALTMDTTGPAYIGGQSANALQADGFEHKIQSSYPILQGVANPYYAYGIHDRLFTTWGTNSSKDDMQGEITATQTASFQPASGAYGLLGIVKFTETSNASGSLGFNNRD